MKPLNPTILAFDIGTRAGWALIQSDRCILSGAVDLRPKPGDHEGKRVLTLARWLESPARPWASGGGYTVDEVAVEDVRSHGRKDAATGQRRENVLAGHVYGALRGVVAAWACARAIPVREVGVGTWKAALSLRGGAHAPKEAVAERLTQMGVRFDTQDEADAIGIGLSAYRDATRASIAPELPMALPIKKARRKKKAGFF